MATFQQAQTGNRVYNGAGTSPNMGAVSAKGAQGYLRRSIKQQNLGRPVGADGKSDRRSGAAAAAMQRFNARNLTVHNNYGPGESGGRPITKPGQVKPNAPSGSFSSQNKGSGGKKGNGLPNPHGTQNPQQIKAPPNVQVSPNGQLNLPYNQNYATAVLNAQNDYQTGLTGLTNDLNAADLDYTTQLNQANKDYGALQSKTLNQNAANGMAFSSRYGTAVANNADSYANQTGSLLSQNNLVHQNYQSSVGSLGTTRDNTIALAAQNYAHSLNDQAGTLGYGRNPQHVSGNTVNTRYSHKKNKGKK